MSIGRRYVEKRSYPRMAIKADMTYTITGKAATYAGFCNNLSHSGIHFSTKHALASGISLEINLDPLGTKINALRARVEVLRVEPAEGKSYGIAGKIVEYT